MWTIFWWNWMLNNGEIFIKFKRFWSNISFLFSKVFVLFLLLTQSITYDFYFIYHNVAHGAVYSAVKNVKSFRAPFKTPFKRRLIMPINFRSKRRLKFNSKLSLKRSCKRSSKHISKRNSQHVKNTNKLLLDWKIINLLCQKLSIRVLKIKTSLKKKRLSWWTHGFGSNKTILYLSHLISWGKYGNHDLSRWYMNNRTLKNGCTYCQLMQII